jgi:tetratricopeptide (TPR) repeat protein
MIRAIKAASIALLLAGVSVPTSFAQSTADNEVTKAVLNVYNQELKENSQNYNVYFRRAYFYYGQNQYLRALSDIDNALKYTPDSDADMLSEEYALRANIYLMTDRTDEALADFNKAYEYAPTSYALLYQKANAEYELGKYSDAKEDFRRLERVNNRSLEALIGQARVAVKENNLGLANEYVDRAVALHPNEVEAYLRRASVRRMMGNNSGAVDDLIIAMSLEKNGSKAIGEIVKMSYTDYNAVISGLSSAISQAPDVGMFYYIRATIAQAHFHYKSAIDDYNTILRRNLYSYHGINGALAQCYYALCRYDDAHSEINHAIAQTADNGEYYITLSKIYIPLGNNPAALDAANLALEKLPENNDALIQKARSAEALRQYSDASNYLGEAAVNDPQNALALILRGWILTTDLNKKADGKKFYQRALDIENQATESLRGFALLGLGNNDQAISWIEDILKDNSNVDGSNEYYAACIYAQIGDIDKSLDMMEQSLNKGYADLYNWTTDNTANINVAPIRNTPRFKQLLQSHDYLFDIAQ